MKIIHILRNLEVGGMERMAVALATEQVRRGHTVAIVEVCKSVGACIPLPDGVEVFKAMHSPRAFLPGTALRLLRFFRKHSPDVVHVHNTLALHHTWLALTPLFQLCHSLCSLLSYTPANCSSSCAAFSFQRFPVVFTKHGMDFVPGIYRHLYRQPTAVACVSSDVRDRYAEKFPEMEGRLFDAVNGVESGQRVSDLDSPHSTVYGPRSTSHVPPPTSLRLIWVGRMSVEKNLPMLVEACRVVREGGAEIELLLLGDGVVWDELPEEDWIEMPGVVDDVCSYLRNSDCFVLPSLTEGLPMALLEVGMVGLPAIVSRVGEMPGIIEKSGGGWIVNPGDFDGLRDCIEQRAKSIEQRAENEERESIEQRAKGMERRGTGDEVRAGREELRERGHALRRYVEEHYSVEQMADDYEAVYEEVR